MRSPTWTAVFVAAGIVSLGAAQSLEDALVAAGASGFAALIDSDPATQSLYHSGLIKTVFAPSDSALSLSWLRGRSDKPAREKSYQGIESLIQIQANSPALPLPGLVLPTALDEPLLNPTTGGNKTQVVVADTRRQPDNSSVANCGAVPPTSPSLLKVSSGFGNVVNVIKADIPFDGGLIQLTDGCVATTCVVR